MHKISRRGVEFVARWESFVPYPYDDKAALVRGRPPEWTGGALRGTATIGFGHTDQAAHPLKVRPGVRVSREEAYAILDVDLDDVERAVNRLVKVPLTQSQFDALCSLTFNMGAGNLRKSSLLARLNRGDYAGARAAFDLYVNSGGVRMRGLQRRRDAEQLLWDGDGEPEAALQNAEDYVETPKEPEVAAAKSLGQSRTIKGAIATGSAIAGPTAGAILKAGEESAPPATVIERVTEIVDHSGKVVDIVKTVHDLAPEPPKSVWSGLAQLLTDPVMIAIFGAVALAAVGFIAYERWRKLRYEGV